MRNFKFKIVSKETAFGRANLKFNARGFTLVETIVMITIAGVIGVILTDTITNVYRSQNKTNSINQTKQNGQTALDTIDKTIRSADRVVCIANPNPALAIGNFNINSLIVVAKQGNFTRIMFRTPKTGYAGENGHIAINYPDTNRANNDEDYCSALVPIVEQEVTRLTNSNPGSGVNISGGTFSRTTQSGYKDVVTIQFNANTGSVSGLAENQTSVQFKTTVELR